MWPMGRNCPGLPHAMNGSVSVKCKVRGIQQLVAHLLKLLYPRWSGWGWGAPQMAGESAKVGGLLMCQGDWQDFGTAVLLNFSGGISFKGTPYPESIYKAENNIYWYFSLQMMNIPPYKKGNWAKFKVIFKSLLTFFGFSFYKIISPILRG